MQVGDIDTLGCALGGDLGLEDFAFFLIAFADVEPVRFEVLDDHIDTLGGVLHDDLELECLWGGDPFLKFPTINEDEAVGLIDTPLDLLERGEREPACQSRHVLDLVVWLHVQQNRFCYDRKHIYVAFAFGSVLRCGGLLLLFALIDAAGLILVPYVHVVLEPEVKLADHAVHCPAVLDHVRDERGDLLDDIDQGHRWTPVLLLPRDQVQQ